MHLANRIIYITCRIISEIMRLMLFAMFLIFISLVTTRYFFSYSPSWSEEIALFLMVWMTMLGASVLVLYQDHFALHVIHGKLSERWRLIHALIIQIAIGLISFLVARESVEFTIKATKVIAPGSGLPMSIAKSSILAGTVLMTIFAALSAIDILFRLLGAKHSFLPLQSSFMSGTFRPEDPSLDDAPQNDPQG